MSVDFNPSNLLVELQLQSGKVVNEVTGEICPLSGNATVENPPFFDLIFKNLTGVVYPEISFGNPAYYFWPQNYKGKTYPSGPFTVSLWLKSTNADDSQIGIFCGNGWSFGKRNGNYSFRLGKEFATDLVIVPNFVREQWQHLVVSCGAVGDKGGVWINGQPQGDTPKTITSELQPQYYSPVVSLIIRATFLVCGGIEVYKSGGDLSQEDVLQLMAAVPNEAFLADLPPAQAKALTHMQLGQGGATHT